MDLPNHYTRRFMAVILNDVAFLKTEILCTFYKFKYIACEGTE
jgi:hypothetical protein